MAQRIKDSTFIAAALQLPRKACRFKQLTAVTLRSCIDCLLIVVVPRITQPSIPPESGNEDQLRLRRQRQVWFIPLVDKRRSVQVKL